MMQTTNSRSEAAMKAAETRRNKKSEQQTIYRRENYQVYNAEEWQTSYPTNSNTLDDVLRNCALMVTDEEYPLHGLTVWLDGILVGAVKPGGNGEAILTDFSGRYPNWCRFLSN